GEPIRSPVHDKSAEIEPSAGVHASDQLKSARNQLDLWKTSAARRFFRKLLAMEPVTDFKSALGSAV
ncbi:hypothetical protein, partial [Synechococcus sp. BA-132 BA5]|uniref:hypothetical protein n=1 Tax=Synechococcus sp. BA-132 BA5 TaxID=3110252 RepID=UPI002B1F3087